MAVTIVECSGESRSSLLDVIHAQREPVAVGCTELSTAMVVASLSSLLRVPVGVCLDVSAGYVAAMAARDLATLSWIVETPLAIVRSTDGRAREHAEIVRALLTDEMVNFTNDLTKLVGAYNRPAPASPITLWWANDDESLESFAFETLTVNAQREEQGIMITEFN